MDDLNRWLSGRPGQHPSAHSSPRTPAGSGQQPSDQSPDTIGLAPSGSWLGWFEEQPWSTNIPTDQVMQSVLALLMEGDEIILNVRPTVTRACSVSSRPETLTAPRRKSLSLPYPDRIHQHDRMPDVLHPATSILACE